jgi:hypothetical protein
VEAAGKQAKRQAGNVDPGMESVKAEAVVGERKAVASRGPSPNKAAACVPFSVIGVKSRLEVIEARLDEIQGEIRHLSLRLPEVSSAPDYDEIYAPEPMVESPRAKPVVTRPPIPPASHQLEEQQSRDLPSRTVRREPDQRQTGGRTEPKLDWPR